MAFECHPQNCVARFDKNTKELKGFVIRDFGGLRIHRETLKASTGHDLDVKEGHHVAAKNLEEVYIRAYSSMIQNHLQLLLRTLELHYNGKGWAIVREELQRLVRRDHPLYDAWPAPERMTFPAKCYLRMRMVTIHYPQVSHIYHREAPYLRITFSSLSTDHSRT